MYLPPHHLIHRLQRPLPLLVRLEFLVQIAVSVVHVSKTLIRRKILAVRIELLFLFSVFIGSDCSPAIAIRIVCLLRCLVNSVLFFT